MSRINFFFKTMRKMAKKLFECDLDCMLSLNVIRVNVSTDILGNAYVSLFFTCGQNPQLSQQALSAYAQSVSTSHLSS